MRDNVIQTKSYQFALDIIRVYKNLYENKREYVLSKQLLRAGTSVGANVEEALGAHTDKDFVCKIAIAFKEAREANYWIRLLRDSGYLEQAVARHLEDASMELIRIMAKIQITFKQNQQNA
ncbi:MAG: four helix bundle protein [Patescibacteria group bacterium]|jgi:four helix bundle protein